MRQINPKIELASGEYELEKQKARQEGFPHRVTLATIERRLKLRPLQLKHYRANYLSRTERFSPHH